MVHSDAGTDCMFHFFERNAGEGNEPEIADILTVPTFINENDVADFSFVWDSAE